MIRSARMVFWPLAIAAIAAAPAALAQDAPPPRPTFKEDGTVQVPAFELPPSNLASEEIAQGLRMASKLKGITQTFPTDIAAVRKMMDGALAPMVAAMTSAYPTDMKEERIAGVPARVFTPKGKPFDRERVLINLHGGAFSQCFDSCSKLESMPIASVGGFKVISLDYRQAPEFKHPAAVEDVAAVYKELLKTYRPKQIGIYGCSAGGALSGQAAAWFARDKVPQPGAIGIFGAGAAPFRWGDSAYIAGYVDGNFPPPAPGAEPGKNAAAFDKLTFGYFAGADVKDPIISAALHKDVIARFPPTLVITGSRAMDMSPAIYTNSALLAAGVESTLIVGESLGHCYIYGAGLPESRDAYGIISRFFKKHLG